MKRVAADGLWFDVRDDADNAIVTEVVTRRCYEKPRLGFTVGRGERWLDLGANIGAFSVWAAKKRAAHVLAVEPVPDNAALARHNVALNRADVEVREAAVSATDGSVVISYNARTPARSSALARAHGEQHTVAGIAFNRLISEYRPHGIKLDIEGGELAILDAGVDLDGVRAIAMEYHFRFDKSCENARRRIAPLLDAFPHYSVRQSVFTHETHGGWIDPIMCFWR